MKKLKAWMAEHKKFSVIALCLLLMFTCGSCHERHQRVASSRGNRKGAERRK